MPPQRLHTLGKPQGSPWWDVGTSTLGDGGSPLPVTMRWEKMPASSVCGPIQPGPIPWAACPWPSA